MMILYVYHDNGDPSLIKIEKIPLANLIMFLMVLFIPFIFYVGFFTMGTEGYTFLQWVWWYIGFPGMIIYIFRDFYFNIFAINYFRTFKGFEITYSVENDKIINEEGEEYYGNENTEIVDNGSTVKIFDGNNSLTFLNSLPKKFWYRKELIRRLKHFIALSLLSIEN